eukprot:Gb_10252 [translate_table: standard]
MACCFKRHLPPQAAHIWIFPSYNSDLSPVLQRSLPTLLYNELPSWLPFQAFTGYAASPMMISKGVTCYQLIPQRMPLSHLPGFNVHQTLLPQGFLTAATPTGPRVFSHSQRSATHSNILQQRGFTTLFPSTSTL